MTLALEASFWSVKTIRLVTALKEINTKRSICNKINIIQRKKTPEKHEILHKHITKRHCY